KHDPDEKEPIALLKMAIEDVPRGPADVRGGALGVKLYPPMGFRATANAEIEDAKFNSPSLIASHDRGIGPHIGSQLDQALNRVYAWCSDKNVPIVAHTNNTFGPSLDYANRADPHFWKRALQSYPKLRVNMAHFGHFNNAVMKDDVKAHVNECWEWVIGDIMHSQPDGYAYADISSIAEILKPGPSRKLFDCMVAFKASF